MMVAYEESAAVTRLVPIGEAFELAWSAFEAAALGGKPADESGRAFDAWLGALGRIEALVVLIGEHAADRYDEAAAMGDDLARRYDRLRGRLPAAEARALDRWLGAVMAARSSERSGQ